MCLREASSTNSELTRVVLLLHLLDIMLVAWCTHVLESGGPLAVLTGKIFESNTAGSTLFQLM